MNRLTIEEVEKWRNLAMSDSIVDEEAGFYARAMYFSKQLLDTMRENERLREALKEAWQVLETRRFIDPICAGHADLLKEYSCKHSVVEKDVGYNVEAHVITGNKNTGQRYCNVCKSNVCVLDDAELEKRYDEVFNSQNSTKT